jgi:Ca2+-binding RTX toxin-like protein
MTSANTLNGTSGIDRLYGLGGNDTLNAAGWAMICSMVALAPTRCSVGVATMSTWSTTAVMS